MQQRFFTGSYAEKGNPGIKLYRLDTEDLTLECLSTYSEVKNPSYIMPYGNLIYAVSETVPDGHLWTICVRDMTFETLSVLPTYGADPCHISVIPEENLLLVSNYTSGSLAVYSLDNKGIPSFLRLISHKGTGVNPDRQEGPHVHFAQVWNNKAAVIDLGLDRISFYPIVNGDISEQEEILNLPAGFGPRHMVNHPENEHVFYVVCELENVVAVCCQDEKGYRVLQTVSTLPEDYTEYNIAAAIRFYEGRLYVSNRGNNSIAVYDVLTDGTVRLNMIFPCGGEKPRDIFIYEELLLAANENSNNIAIIPLKDGTPDKSKEVVHVHCDSPTCIIPWIRNTK